MEIKKAMPVFESKPTTMYSDNKNTEGKKNNHDAKQDHTKSFSEILEKEIEKLENK